MTAQQMTCTVHFSPTTDFVLQFPIITVFIMAVLLAFLSFHSLSLSTHSFPYSIRNNSKHFHIWKGKDKNFINFFSLLSDTRRDGEKGCRTRTSESTVSEARGREQQPEAQN